MFGQFGNELMSQRQDCNETWTCQQTVGPKIQPSEVTWQVVQYHRSRASKQPILPDLPEASRLRTFTIMKSVRFSYSQFVSYYFLVLKVIKLLLFSPSRSSNCINRVYLSKRITLFWPQLQRKIQWYLLKIRLNVSLYRNVNF